MGWGDGGIHSYKSCVLHYSTCSFDHHPRFFFNGKGAAQVNTKDT